MRTVKSRGKSRAEGKKPPFDPFSSPLPLALAHCISKVYVVSHTLFFPLSLSRPAAAADNGWFTRKPVAGASSQVAGLCLGRLTLSSRAEYSGCKRAVYTVVNSLWATVPVGGSVAIMLKECA